MRRRLGTTAILCTLALSLLGASSYSEADLKAALILRIAKYVEWPSGPSTAPVCIGVLGKDVFSREAQAALEERGLQGRSVYLRTSVEVSDLTDCPIVFVSDAPPTPELQAHPVLTIGDAPGFARQGGIIELVKERGRLGMIVNRTAEKRSGLRVSSTLLRMAAEVYEESE